MKISVRVKPNAKKNYVEQVEENSFRVHVTAPPVEGKANEKVIELLAEHFDVPKRCIVLLKGEKGRDKVFEITSK
jgi:uncharacterized protein